MFKYLLNLISVNNIIVFIVVLEQWTLNKKKLPLKIIVNAGCALFYMEESNGLAYFLLAYFPPTITFKYGAHHTCALYWI